MDSLDRFENVCEELRQMFIRKNEQYGDSAFYDDPWVPEFKWWMRLSDVLRKTTRLVALTRGVCATPPDEKNAMAKAKLIDDYKDLAIYAIIAVAVLEEK